jgi:hypothetical protein
MIIMMLGGMIGPMIAEAAVTAALKLLSYPALRIILISTAPRPLASAMAAPLIPAKNMLASTLVWPIPPRMRPMIRSANRIRRLVIPLALMISAAKMKSGTASRTK